MKILVIRNDKLGDFVQAFPAFAMLKASNPELKLTALVPAYTAPLAQICPYLDDVIIDSAKNDKADFNRLIKEIKEQQFDGMISFFSNTHNGKLAWKSGIPYRLAPATKWVQILYNHRLTQRRSRSEKSEAEYNQDLARAFLNHLTFHFLKVRLKINVFFFKNNSVYRRIKNGSLCIVEQVAQQQAFHCRNMLN